MLWLKGIGVISLLITGSLIGLRFSQNLEMRKIKLNKFYIFTNELWGGIKRGEEIDSILQNSTAKNLIYKDGVNIKPEPVGLKVDDIKILTEFFSVLGMGDTESQISRCQVFSELIQKQLNLAEQEVKEKSKLYSALGFFSGLFLVILLI